MLKKILVLFLFIVFSSPVFASNWEEITYKTYLDLDSWTYKDGYSYIWVKILNQGHQKPINSQKVWYEMQKLSIDCTNKKMKLLNGTSYGLNNQVLESFIPPPKYSIWADIIPDSIGDELYNYVCRRSNRH